MRKIILGAVACFLSFAALPLVTAHAQSRFPAAQASAISVRTYLGCFVDSQRYLSLRNTTSATIRLGTPVYWTGKQVGQQQPYQYSAPLYANVAPGGVYRIGGVYKYDSGTPCRVWIMRRAAATRAP